MLVALLLISSFLISTGSKSNQGPNYIAMFFFSVLVSKDKILKCA